MRNELNNIEQVDLYLDGKLSKEAAEEINNKLQSDVAFKEHVELQQQVRAAAHRKGLRNEIYEASNAFKFRNKLKKGLIIAGIAGLVIVGSVYFISTSVNESVIPVESKELVLTQVENVGVAEIPEEEISTEEVAPKDVKAITQAPKVTWNANTVLSVFDEAIKDTVVGVSAEDSRYDFNGLKTWVKPLEQSFTVAVTEGGLLEGRDGTIVVVPQNAFVHEDGSSVQGSVEVKLVEALQIDDIILYNLTTTASGKALQTRGMLHLEFLSDGIEVNVNPKTPLYIEVPTKEKTPGMIAFKGEVENGRVNWKNPKPLKKYLVNVDFELLDFLPKNFADTVEVSLPFRKQDKFSESAVNTIYYNLIKEEAEGHKTAGFKGQQRRSLKDIKESFTDSPVNHSLPFSIMSSDFDEDGSSINTYNYCGIEPSSIKIIREKKFAKTFIATKEFEERVAQLHLLDNGSQCLGVYLKNLNKDMSYSDEVVADMAKGANCGVFKTFAAQKLTNIKETKIHQKYLTQYYNQKLRKGKANTIAYEAKLRRGNASELNSLRSKYNRAVDKSNPPLPIVVSASNVNNTVSNLRSTSTTSVATSRAYSFPWTSRGWVNIDAYLHMLSKGSQQVVININGNAGGTEVYQYLSKVNNITPLYLEDKTAKVLVPKANTPGAKSMENTFCMALSKDGDQFYFGRKQYNPYTQPHLKLQLNPTTESVIRSKLREYGVKKDLMHRAKELEKDIIRAKKLAKRRKEKQQELARFQAKKLRALKKKRAKQAIEHKKLIVFKKVAFKCYAGETENVEIEFNDEIQSEGVDVPALDKVKMKE